MKIIEYNNNKDMTVQFMDEFGYTVNHVCYSNFEKGKVKNIYHKNLYGGYIGEIGEKQIGRLNDLKSYRTWIYILKRCNEKDNETYKDCVICDEWYNFTNFHQWFNDNYYEVPGENMQIDKDLLYKDNGIYSPEKCCFLTSYLNHLIIYKTIDNGLPPGVSFDKDKQAYASYCTKRGKHYFCGYFNTPEAAFYAYKKNKRKIY